MVQEGVSSKFNEVKQFLSVRKPHCLAIIESDVYKLTSNVARVNNFSTSELQEVLKIDGYKLELPNTWEVHGQARILCYVSEEINYIRRLFTPEFDHIPSITLELGLGKASKTIVHYYYREWKNGVTGGDNQQSQIDDLKLHIRQWTELVTTGRNFISIGDANLCAMSWNESNYRHKELASIVQQFMVDESCFQLVQRPTRIQSVGGVLQQSCLDHVTTNVPEKCSLPEIIPAGSSDHLPVIITKYSRELRSQPKTVRKRSYRKFNVEHFLHDVYSHSINGSFQKILDSHDVDEASKIFSDTFGAILNRHAPLKVFQIRNNYCPWISEETKTMMDARNRLQKEAIEEHCNEKFAAYKRLRNRVKSRLASDKLEYYKNKFYNNDTSVSAQWKHANDYLNTSKSSFSNTPGTIKHEGKVVTAPKDVANSINDCFLKKVARLRDNISQNAQCDPRDRLKSFLGTKLEGKSQFRLKEITCTELRLILKKRKGNRSSGIDYIDGYSVKLAAPLIEDVLLHLVNLTIGSSKYPQLWKINKVSPHFKKGDKMLGENWRPVTDIVFVSKLAEAAVLDQVTKYFQEKILWHPNHHGFRPSHSTATAISQLYDIWIRNAEKKELTATLLLDLSAAFDIVDHVILIEKLRLYNFSLEAIQWFKSYLEERSQIVVVESKLSDPRKVGEQSVPQGSLLGPILFLIYYNDFPHCRKGEGSSVLYADDDSDTISDSDPDILKQKIQRVANESTSWVHDNKLVCSGAKTKLLVAGTKELRRAKLTCPLEIDVAGHRVTESDSERLLGLVVNNKMTWDNYLYGDENNRGLISKLEQRAAMIVKLSSVMPLSRLKQIAEGIFFSLLNYCIDVYGNTWGLESLDTETRHSSAFRREDNRRIQVVVNKVLRILLGMDRDTPTSTLCELSGQLSVHQRVAFFTLCSVYKVLSTGMPDYSFKLLKNNDARRHRTGTMNHCQRIDYKLSISRDSHMYRCSRLFNMLPVDVTNAVNFNSFKKVVKPWVMANIPAQP